MAERSVDGLRIQSVMHHPVYFSYRSMRSTPNTVRLLGAPAFLHYILMRRAKLQPLLVSSSMVSTCADGARDSCTHAGAANQAASEFVNKAMQPFAAQLPLANRNLPLLEIDWPHKASEKEIAVYIEELQQPVAPVLTGTVLDLIF